MLGDKIRELRNTKEITQEELAKVIGVTTSMVGMYETGARKPSFEVLLKISKYFNVSIDYLMGAAPFKNEIEAYHSIYVASVKYFQDHFEEIPSYWDLYSYFDVLHGKVSKEVEAYCDSLILKFEKGSYLTDLELFELANILFSEIRWSPDFDGIVYLENFHKDTLTIKLDFNDIPKLTLDLNESFLFKYKNSNELNFIKRHSLFSAEENLPVKSLPPVSNTKDDDLHVAQFMPENEEKPTTIAAHFDGEELTPEEMNEINNFIKYVLSKRNK